MKQAKRFSALLIVVVLLSCWHRTSAQEAGGLSASVFQSKTALQEVQTEVEKKLAQLSDAEQPATELRDLAGFFQTKSNRCSEIAQNIGELTKIALQRRDDLNSNHDLPADTKQELLGVLDSQLKLLDEFGKRIREIERGIKYLDGKRKQWLALHTSTLDISGEGDARKALRDAMEKAKADWLNPPTENREPKAMKEFDGSDKSKSLLHVPKVTNTQPPAELPATPESDGSSPRAGTLPIAFGLCLLIGVGGAAVIIWAVLRYESRARKSNVGTGATCLRPPVARTPAMLLTPDPLSRPIPALTPARPTASPSAAPSAPRSPNSGTGMATASLVLGILSLVLFGLGLPLGIVAVVLAAITRRQVRSGLASEAGLGRAQVALITGAIGIVLNTVVWIFYAAIVVWFLSHGSNPTGTRHNPANPPATSGLSAPSRWAPATPDLEIPRQKTTKLSH